MSRSLATIRIPIVVAILQIAAVHAPPIEGMPPHESGPSLDIETTGLGISGHLRSVLVMPGDSLTLPVRIAGVAAANVAVRWTPAYGTGAPITGRVASDGRTVAPAIPGAWTAAIATADTVRPLDTFTVLVKVPATAIANGRLNGYRMGAWPASAVDRYAPPAGFIEVTEATQNLLVSRGFRLRDFLTHDQTNVWPKYVLIQTRLLDKLELLADELADDGITGARFTVMSGFRTPQYNVKGLDQGRATLSRHQYGDAADIWVDADRDGIMDDLDHNGRHDRADAVVLAHYVDRLEARFPELVGGAGAYAATPAHGPFVHVDARGVRARW
jgi:hypothetical protein